MQLFLLELYTYTNRTVVALERTGVRSAGAPAVLAQTESPSTSMILPSGSFSMGIKSKPVTAVALEL